MLQRIVGATVSCLGGSRWPHGTPQPGTGQSASAHAALVSAAEHLEITASVNVTVTSIVFDSCSLYYLIYIIF